MVFHIIIHYSYPFTIERCSGCFKFFITMYNAAVSILILDF